MGLEDESGRDKAVLGRLVCRAESQVPRCKGGKAAHSGWDRSTGQGAPDCPDARFVFSFLIFLQL
jgi:hypothetical protein